MSANEGWLASAAYAEMLATASDLGLSIDGEVKAEAEWGLTLAEASRFHAEWSRRMRKRAGIPERGQGDLDAVCHYSRRGSDDAVARREAAKRAKWEAADTRTNAVLRVVPDDPEEAMTATGVAAVLGVDPRSTDGRATVALLSDLYRRGKFSRVMVPRQGPGPRTEWAYWRAA